MKKLSLFQILVACGTRNQRHPQLLAKKFNKKENYISSWASIGIPYRYWNDISEMSDVYKDEICDAQAHALGKSYEFIAEKYREAITRVVED